MRVDLKVVLVAPEIPQNTGSIGRLCVNLDVPLHLIKPLGFSLAESRVKRAGLDYWPHLKLAVHETWDDFLAAAKPERLILASTKGKASLFDCRFQNGDYLVFGSETTGLPSGLYRRYADSLYRIPMPGKHYRSLNLACAVAVVVYEAYRQITAAGQGT